MAKTATNRKKKPPKLTSREKLLATTAELMTEQGSVDVSLKELSDRSGVNAALVKYYFGSKSGMMMALIKDVVGESIDRLNELVELDIPPDEKLNLHIRGIVNTYFYHPYCNRLLHRMGRIEGGKYGDELSKEIVGPLVEAQTKILEEGLKLGMFRKVDPMYFYFHSVGACDSLFQVRYALKPVFGIKKITASIKDEYAKRISTMILNGIRVNP